MRSLLFLLLLEDYAPKTDLNYYFRHYEVQLHFFTVSELQRRVLKRATVLTWVLILYFETA